MLEEPNGIVAEIEKNYPFKYSGIDWSDDNYIRTLSFRNQEPILKQIYIENFLREIKNNYRELGSENITVLGDYMTNLTFEMRFAHFVTIHKEMFSIKSEPDKLIFS